MKELKDSNDRKRTRAPRGDPEGNLPHLMAWHATKLTKVQCQGPFVLTKSISISSA
jgi:hypothetical protein